MRKRALNQERKPRTDGIIERSACDELADCIGQVVKCFSIEGASWDQRFPRDGVLSQHHSTVVNHQFKSLAFDGAPVAQHTSRELAGRWKFVISADQDNMHDFLRIICESAA